MAGKANLVWGGGAPGAQGWVHSVIVCCSPHPSPVCSVTPGQERCKEFELECENSGICEKVDGIRLMAAVGRMAGEG